MKKLKLTDRQIRELIKVIGLGYKASYSGDGNYNYGVLETISNKLNKLKNKKEE